MFTTTRRLLTLVLLMTAMLAAGTVQAWGTNDVTPYYETTHVTDYTYNGVRYRLYRETNTADGTVRRIAFLCYEDINTGNNGNIGYEEQGIRRAEFSNTVEYANNEVFTLYNNALTSSVEYNPNHAAEPVYKGSLNAEAMAKINKVAYVTVENGIKTIGDDFFWGWNNMKQVNVSNSVDNIGEQAFNGCAALEKVVLDYDGNNNTSLLSLAPGAFINCKRLTSVAMPTGRNYTFLHYTNGGTYSNIGAQFYGCTALKEIHLTQTVTAQGGKNSLYALPEYIFGGCNSLEKVILDTNVPADKICKHAFDINRNYGTDKTINPVRYIQMPFTHTADPWYTDATCLVDTKNATATLTKLGAYQKSDYVVPDNIHLDEYTSADGVNRYMQCGIPNATVTALGNGALVNLTAKRMWLPKTIALKVTEGNNSDVLGTATFNTSALNRLYFYTDDGVYYYAGNDDNENFSVLHYNQNTNINTTVNGTQQANDNSLVNIYVPDYVPLSNLGNAVLTAVPEDAFNYNKSIQTVQFVSRGESRTPLTLGNRAFRYMETIKELTLAPHVDIIGNYCFGNCTSLEKVVIPNISYTATEGSKATLAIYPNAFENCTKLGVIRLGEGITLIGGSAFSQAAAVSVVLPTTLNTLGTYCFGKLTAVVMQKNDGNTEADDLTAKKEMIKDLKFGTASNPDVKIYYLTNGTFNKESLPEAIPTIEYRYASLSGKGKAGTVYFTHDIDLNNSYNIKGIYTATSLNDDKSSVVLTEDSDPFGEIPYIYFFNDDDPNRLTIFADAGNSSVSDTPEDGLYGLLQGVSTDTKYVDIAGGGYVLQSDGLFHKFSDTEDKGFKVPAGRAYIPASMLNTEAGAKLAMVFGDDTPTGISTVKTATDSHLPMYNLAGQRITAPANGQIYIQGGKKHIKQAAKF